MNLANQVSTGSGTFSTVLRTPVAETEKVPVKNIQCLEGKRPGDVGVDSTKTCSLSRIGNVIIKEPSGLGDMGSQQLKRV